MLYIISYNDNLNSNLHNITIRNCIKLELTRYGDINHMTPENPLIKLVSLMELSSSLRNSEIRLTNEFSQA